MVLRRVNEHFDALHQRVAPEPTGALSALSQQPLGATIDPTHLRAAEGTTLLHYTLAIRQQQVWKVERKVRGAWVDLSPHHILCFRTWAASSSSTCATPAAS